MEKTTKQFDSPLVSVIMPAYNCEAYVAEALDSVINQTYRNLEIIIVDDHSTDQSWQIIQDIAQKDARIKPFRNKTNLKIVGTLNFAISQSHGTYLARMDSDDTRELSSIATQVEYLEKNPKVVVVGGAAEFCDERMRHLNDRHYPLTDAAIRHALFRYSPFCHAGLVIRANVLEKDPYRENWAEDYDLYFRIAKTGEMANLDNVLYHVRTHERSVSRSKTRYQEKLTLYIRLKAVFEYGYTMTAMDKIYFMAQFLSMYMMPSSFRFWLFNKLRASD